MSATQTIIDVIKREIPIAILKKAFLEFTPYNILNPSLDHVIKEKILFKWILRDLDLVAGIETLISIENVPVESVEFGQILRIGYNVTGGKDITSVLSVGYGLTALTGGHATIVSSLDIPYQTTNARIELVGPNVVYIEGYLSVPLTVLKCTLANDKDFNNISPRSLLDLAEMCCLATKGYIYNNLVLDLANAKVVGGVDYGAMMEIVNSYADCNEKYKIYRDTEWKKIKIMSDPMTRNRTLRWMLPS